MDYRATRHRILLCGASVLLAVTAASSSAQVPSSPFQSLSLVTSILTDETIMLSGKLIPLDKFTSQDTIRANVWFTWKDITKPAGKHSRVWRCFKNETLVCIDSRDDVEFSHSPFNLYWTESAPPLGTGSFKLDLSVDGRTVYSTQFTIVSASHGK